MASLIQVQWAPALLEAFGPSVEASPFGWGTALEVLRGAHAWELQAGPRRALLAVRPVAREHGLRLDVAGLVSLGERVRGAEWDAALRDLGARYNARALCMATQVPHVARTAQRLGWHQTGAIYLRPTGRDN